MVQPEAEELKRQLSPNGSEAAHVSLVRGGPFYRAQVAARLVEHGRWKLGRRVLFAIALGWLPRGRKSLIWSPPTTRSSRPQRVSGKLRCRHGIKGRSLVL
jgi:hypothetical protein